ncbi:MAG: enoyl-CoA hydratase [Chloroflexota bacterium]|nr:enoyl-CoA hydratase [Chloroflexota bacterium]
MAYETLVLEKDDNGIATITLDRPSKMNSLTEQLIDELVMAINEVSQDSSVKVVILTGSGRAFCAGGDLDLPLFSMTNPTDMIQFLGRTNQIPLGLRNMAKPVIAAMNGATMGAGCSIAMACDIIIASENATFGQAFVNVGYHPDTGSSYFLPRLVGISKACELIFTGRAIDAIEAKEMGLVSQVVPADALMDTARELATKIANGPSVAIGLAKTCIYDGLHANLDQALDREAQAASLSLMTEDQKEGVKAFKEKRKPQFKGQ